MSSPPQNLFLGVPRSLVAALGLALVFVAFITVDQMHWWRLKPDYSFGWLVPLLVLYVVHDRWSRLRAVFSEGDGVRLRGWMPRATTFLAGGLLVGGSLLFALGALYRAGAGVTQPGSLLLACGFSGVVLGLVYFSVPAGATAAVPSRDRRLRVATVFLFPALIWILSAPLVSAVENAISLFLLRQVIQVVFTVFSFLGYPLVQEGNVLLLPLGRVGVADACSGIRSLTACLFAGSFLAAVMVVRWWQKLLLIVAAMTLAFLTNLLRSLFLTAWAYANGSDAIGGTMHDATGYAVLGLTVVGLLLLLPLFEGAKWRRWLGVTPPPGPVGTIRNGVT